MESPVDSLPPLYCSKRPPLGYCVTMRYRLLSSLVCASNGCSLETTSLKRRTAPVCYPEHGGSVSDSSDSHASLHSLASHPETSSPERDNIFPGSVHVLFGGYKTRIVLQGEIDADLGPQL